MTYYKDYRLWIVEKNGKYTIYDDKYNGRAIYKNKSKEWTDNFIRRVLSKRNTRTKKIKKSFNSNIEDSMI